MSSWDLRWILLVIGGLILIVLYVLGRRHRSRHSDDLLDLEDGGEQTPAVFINPAREREEPVLEGLDDNLQKLNSLVREEVAISRGTQSLSHSAAPHPAPAPPRTEGASATRASPPAGPAPEEATLPADPWPDEVTLPAESPPPPEPASETRQPPRTQVPSRPEDPPAQAGHATTIESERLIVMHVAAPRPYMISGTALFEALEGVGLEHEGEQGIYHWMVEQYGGKQPVFQVANMVKPGVLDPARADRFSTPGVSLFMRLPGPMEALKAFNTMLECAQTLASQLDAQVLDQSRGALSRQAAELMREEIQLFSLRHEQRRPV